MGRIVGLSRGSRSPGDHQVASIGYTLSSEEFGPRELVGFARRAEAVGFDFLSISDHFHPWVDRQGNSPFVWAVLGGVAEATERIEVGTGVTCPTTRIHPAIVAQAAATAAAMLPRRFFLGVGSGENLNEHILAEHWPETKIRQERLEEAVEVIRLLWQGGLKAIAAATTRSRMRAFTPCRMSSRRSSSPGRARRPPTWPAESATGSSASSPIRR